MEKTTAVTSENEGQKFNAVPAFAREPRFWALVLLVALVVSAFLAYAPAQAHAQSFSFDFSSIDLQPFFDGLAVWLPLFIGIFGFVGAIVGAMALARMLINAVINAFRGNSL